MPYLVRPTMLKQAMYEALGGFHSQLNTPMHQTYGQLGAQVGSLGGALVGAGKGFVDYWQRPKERRGLLGRLRRQPKRSWDDYVLDGALHGLSGGATVGSTLGRTAADIQLARQAFL